jgi:hypothetical protein
MQQQQNGGGYNGYPPNYSAIGYNGYNGQYDGVQQPADAYVWINGQQVTVNQNPYNPYLQSQQNQPQNPYEMPAPQYGYQGYPQQQNAYNPYQPSYTNYYGNQSGYNYYNPAYQQQLYEQQRKEAEQRRMQEIEYMKQISRCAHAYNGEEITEEELDAIYNPQDTRTQKQIKEEMEFEKTAHIVQYGQRVDYQSNQAKVFNDIKKYHDKFIDPNANLVEFLEQAGSLYVDSLMREEKHKRRSGLNKTYDNKGFQNALQNPYPNRFSNVEDDVIHLPKSIQNKLTSTYAERRAQFMEKILSQQQRR